MDGNHDPDELWQLELRAISVVLRLHQLHRESLRGAALWLPSFDHPTYFLDHAVEGLRVALDALEARAIQAQEGERPFMP